MVDRKRSEAPRLADGPTVPVSLYDALQREAAARIESDAALLAASRERADKLHKALRDHTILTNEYRDEDGDVHIAFFECRRCHARWDDGNAERHAKGCLAAPPSTGGAEPEQQSNTGEPC